MIYRQWEGEVYLAMELAQKDAMRPTRSSGEKVTMAWRGREISAR